MYWTQGDHDGGVGWKDEYRGLLAKGGTMPSTEKTHPRKLYMESYQTEGLHSHSVAKSSSRPTGNRPMAWTASAGIGQRARTWQKGDACALLHDG